MSDFDDRSPFLVAEVLDRRCSFSQQQAESEQPEEEECVTVFHAASFPDLTVAKYAERILRYGKCSHACFVNALVLIDRVIAELPPKFQLSYYCVHRLFVVCVLLSAKNLDDVYYSNRHWSRVAGLSLRELNALELDTLDLLEWRAFVSCKEYEETARALQEGIDPASLRRSRKKDKAKKHEDMEGGGATSATIPLLEIVVSPAPCEAASSTSTAKKCSPSLTTSEEQNRRGRSSSRVSRPLSPRLSAKSITDEEQFESKPTTVVRASDHENPGDKTTFSSVSSTSPSTSFRRSSLSSASSAVSEMQMKENNKTSENEARRNEGGESAATGVSKKKSGKKGDEDKRLVVSSSLLHSPPRSGLSSSPPPSAGVVMVHPAAAADLENGSLSFQRNPFSPSSSSESLLEEDSGEGALAFMASENANSPMPVAPAAPSLMPSASSSSLLSSSSESDLLHPSMRSLGAAMITMDKVENDKCNDHEETGRCDNDTLVARDKNSDAHTSWHNNNTDNNTQPHSDDDDYLSSSNSNGVTPRSSSNTLEDDEILRVNNNKIIAKEEDDDEREVDEEILQLRDQLQRPLTACSFHSTAIFMGGAAGSSNKSLNGGTRVHRSEGRRRNEDKSDERGGRGGAGGGVDSLDMIQPLQGIPSTNRKSSSSESGKEKSKAQLVKKIKGLVW